MHRGVILVGLGSLLASSAACGDDDGGGGGVSSGVPRDTLLSDLDDAQARQACENVVASLDDVLTSELRRFQCTLAALPMSISVTLAGELMGDVGKCRALASDCVAGRGAGDGGTSVPDPAPVGSQIQCGSAAATAAVQSCDVTVGEYEDCVNAIVDNAKSCLRQLDCSLAAEPERVQDLQQPRPAAPLPDLCVDIDSRCPQLGLPSMGGNGGC